METIYLQLFSALQLGFGGFLFAFRLNEELKSSIGRLLLITFLFLIVNFANILNFPFSTVVVEICLSLLPPSLIFFYYVRLPFAKELSQKWKIRSVVALILLFTISWGTIHFLEGYAVSMIPPLLILMTFFMATLLLNYSIEHNKKQAIYLFYLLAICGLVVSIIFGFIFNVGFNTFLILNIIYIFIIAEFFYANTGIFFRTPKRIEVIEPIIPNLLLGDFDLTDSELFVADQLMKGRSFKEMAKLSGQSIPALHKQASNLYRKTNTISAISFVVAFLPREDRPKS